MEPPVTAPNVRYIPHAIPDPDAALARLIAEVAWVDAMRARRTASFGRPYNYSGQTYPAAPMHEVVQAIAERVAVLAGHPFDNCLCNLYETGHNTMGFHTDSYAELVPESFIAIASLGAARPLVFRTLDHAHRTSIRLEHGSILLMDRATQARWEHAVPRARDAGLRISLTFRQFR
jgi:alkylated DNA repair dioxygenase AlkB